MVISKISTGMISKAVLHIENKSLSGKERANNFENEQGVNTACDACDIGKGVKCAFQVIPTNFREGRV